MDLSTTAHPLHLHQSKVQHYYLSLCLLYCHLLLPLHATMFLPCFKLAVYSCKICYYFNCIFFIVLKIFCIHPGIIYCNLPFDIKFLFCCFINSIAINTYISLLSAISNFAFGISLYEKLIV